MPSNLHGSQKWQGQPCLENWHNTSQVYLSCVQSIIPIVKTISKLNIWTLILFPYLKDMKQTLITYSNLYTLMLAISMTGILASTTSQQFSLSLSLPKKQNILSLSSSQQSSHIYNQNTYNNYTPTPKNDLKNSTTYTLIPTSIIVLSINKAQKPNPDQFYGKSLRKILIPWIPYLNSAYLFFPTF